MKNNVKKQRKHGNFYRLLLDSILRLNNPLWKQINISQIKINENGQKCLIYYTVFGNTLANNITIFLKKNTGVLKKMMSSKWKGRTMPELIFIYDQILTEAEKVQKILQNLKNDK